MKKLFNKSQQGFTLIEVVLVLAIGGLIFLLAFLAFQQVASNRRDAQRKSDAGRVVAELQNQFTNTKSYPTVSLANSDICGAPVNILDGFITFTNQYLCKNSEFKSPSGTNYTVAAGDNTDPLAKDQVRYSSTRNILGGVAANTNCDGTAMASGGYKVEIGLEKGGLICRDAR